MDFHLSGGEIPLEVRHIVHGVPETELYRGKDGKLFFCGSVVGEGQLVDLTAIAHRNKCRQFCGKSVFTSIENGVAHAVTAAIAVQFRFRRHPARIPYGIALFNVIVVTVAVIRNIVVTIPGEAEQLCVFIEAIASAGVRNQGEEILRAKIVNPWQRGLWGSDDIFFVCVIKIAEFHK